MFSALPKGTIQTSKDALGDLEAFLLHPRQRGTGAMLDLHSLCEASLLEHEVIVGGRIHSIEDIGIVGDFQLWEE